MDNTKKTLEKLTDKLYLNHLETMHIYHQIINILENEKNNKLDYWLCREIIREHIDKHTNNYKITNKYINGITDKYFNK